MTSLGNSVASAGRNSSGWDAARAYLLRHCGVVLSADQSYLLEPRLLPVAKQHRFADVDSFVTTACRVAPTAPLGMALIDALTTHETMFFRDPSFWKGVEQLVLPQLQRCDPARKLRIWSAACSTGQEPYSLAMLLDELAVPRLADASIVATDVATLAVDRARTGIYTTFEANRGLGAVRLQRHFKQAAGGFQIADKYRSRIDWSTHNLLESPIDVGRYDLLLCRNVLIYFSEVDRGAVIERLFAAVRPGGYLAVGSTESIRDATAIAPGIYVKPAAGGGKP